jgi:hypothetical protein
MKRMSSLGTVSRRIATGVAAGAAMMIPAQALAQGCAMCATYLADGHDPVANAFKVSILFLMAMPFTIVGTVGTWIFWMYRRNQPRRPALRGLHAEQEGMS